MKKILYAGIAVSLALAACNKSSEQPLADEKEFLSSCNIEFGGISFKKAKNSGEKSITVMGDTLKFIAGAKTDYFCSPNGDVINNAPAIFTEIDNTKPFTFTAKVEPKFTEEGTYSAGVIYAYEDRTHCQKVCFEQDEYGDHRIVTVRTIGTSDDNNHQAIAGSSVYMRLSSDGTQLGTYFSEDGQTWHMARLYKNDFPEKLLLGLSSQSPKANQHTCYFTDVALANEAVKDFRTGKLGNE